MRGLKGRERGWVIEEGQPAASPSARESGERCKLSQRDPGRNPGRPSGFLHFIDARWLLLASQ